MFVGDEGVRRHVVVAVWPGYSVAVISLASLAHVTGVVSRAKTVLSADGYQVNEVRVQWATNPNFLVCLFLLRLNGSCVHGYLPELPAAERVCYPFPN